MELKQLLSDNVQEFFDKDGELYTSELGYKLVMGWILEFYEFRGELWEGPDEENLIATAVRTADVDDFAKMAGIIRKNARHYAEHLIAEHEGYLIQCNQTPEPEMDYGRLIMDDCMAFTKKYIENI